MICRRTEDAVRGEDEKRIGNAYDAAPKHHVPDRKFRDAMGVHLDEWHGLYVEVRRDLAKGAPWGFHWWPVDPELTHWRRVFIADHLFCAVQDVPASLVEARFHLLELHDAHEREARRQRGGKAMAESPREHAEDHLPRLAANVHAKGLVRALGTAFDCVAAAVIGVCALPTKNIILADMPMVLDEKRWPKGTSETEVFQRETLSAVARAIKDAGEPGWHAWFDALRNTFVHRPARVDISGIKVSMLYDGDGDVVVSDVVHRMPREPALSDVQMFLAHPDRQPVLAELAGTTMDALVATAMRAINDVARVLRDVWAKRKARPDWLLQPAKQWADEALPSPSGFAGFAPGSAPYDPSGVKQNAPIKERLVAAGLLSHTPEHNSPDEGSASGSGRAPAARPADARATPTATGEK